MRAHYYSTEIDLGSSGAAPFSIARLRSEFGVDLDGMDAITLSDGEPLGAEQTRSLLSERFALGDAERVMTTCGSSEGMFLTMSTLLERGDEVVVVQPAYQQLASIARSIGCRVVPWSLEPTTFRADVEKLDGLVGPRTRMVIVNFPHNPTGSTLTLEEYDEVVRIAERAGAYLLWDAAFEDITYGAPPLPHPDMAYERAITLGTVSKSYGLPGLRFGWCLASPEILRSYVRIRDYITLHLSPVLEFVVHRVLTKADALIADRLALATRNLAILDTWLAATGLDATSPRGGVSAAVDVSRAGDVTAFCKQLAAEQSVLLVPGEVFGPQLASHVRLGFATETEDLVEGLGRLDEGLAHQARKGLTICNA